VPQNDENPNPEPDPGDFVIELGPSGVPMVYTQPDEPKPDAKA
jgi:hypothetical protein